jgi:hypothetical protein
MNETSMSREKRALFVTLAVWAVVCAIFEFVRVPAFLHFNDPSDVYEKTWGFQLIVFLIFRFPIWFAGLVVIVCGELIYLRFIAPRNRKN